MTGAPEPDRAMLAGLVCPATQGALRWDRERGELVSRTIGLAFPIRDGVPVLVVGQARPVKAD